MFLLKKKNLQHEALNQKCQYLQVVYSVYFQVRKKDLNSWTVDGGHLECKVQQMNILAWKFITSKVWNITVWYSGDGNLLKTGMSEGYWGYRRGACT